MAITIPLTNERIVEVEELLQYIGRHVDPDDRASVVAAAPYLHGLSLNKAALVELLNEDLARCLARASDSIFYSHHSLILGGAERLTIRANLWPPVSKFAGVAHRKVHVDRVYAYNYPHDHNFDFLTVGWVGHGYSTDIWQYRTKDVRGLPGERVDMTFLESTTLTEGKVMLFRDGEDIHIQHAPIELSVSLNLLVETRNTAVREQYIFDTEARTILGYATGTHVSRSVLTIQLAALIGNDATFALLHDVAKCGATPRVRTAANHSIAAMCGETPSPAETLVEDGREASECDRADVLDSIAEGLRAGQVVHRQ